MRESFNLGDQDPANMLYLLARCVKGAVRYNKNGNFSQSPDKRRHGLKPQNLATNTFEISKLLKGKVKFSSVDFKEVLTSKIHEKLDIVFLDPPYKTNFAIEAIKIVLEKNLLKEDAMIIIETDDSNRILESLKSINCEMKDIRKYGRAYLIFLKRV